MPSLLGAATEAAMGVTRKTDENGQRYIECRFRGRQVLTHPLYNKGTAFSDEERWALRLTGLIPNGHSTVEQQIQRVYRGFDRKGDDLEKYIGLVALQDRNEHLFYQVLSAHIEEMLPIVYTPTVGLACQRFSHILRRTRGLWITPDDKGRIAELLRRCPFDGVQLIVATDNERILGLGDQGAGGMGIPIGKLALYTVAAGIDPGTCLPISLDVGTDNEELLDDPLYVGYPHKRLRGAEYDALIEEFVEAVKEVFPDALLQWEDFKKQNAIDLLDRYRERILSFNDDIQGTAAVAVAGVMAAARVTKTACADERVVILGAGAAGVGIARLLKDHFSRNGVSGDALATSVAVLDSKGLLLEGREYRDEYKKEFAWTHAQAKKYGIDPEGALDLEAVVAGFKPTVLVGTSGQPDTFTESIVKSMAAHCEQPAIFPFSNPTSKAEAKPVDILRWTEGRALVATGSPFDPVEVGGRVRHIGQGNNVYIFPGVGLGALAAKATKVTEPMFTVAANALGEYVSEQTLETGSLFPPLRELRSISRVIAKRVARQAMDDNVAPNISDDEIETRLTEMMWSPEYLPVRPV